MRKAIFMLGAVLSLAAPLLSQTKEEEAFTLRISEIKRTGHTCTVLAASEKLTYQLTSNVSAACAMLAAGNDYKAYRATSGSSTNQEKEDFAVLIILNNVENKRRPNAVFEIASEKVLNLKLCPSNDPLGLYTDEACQPLPPQKKN